jgi:hypothetical protein
MYSYVYINDNVSGGITYSGIKFHEFYEYLDSKFDNIILLKGDYLGNKRVQNFELLEGREQVELLVKSLKKASNNPGNFHFMDYSQACAISKLTDEEIKDILYLSHIWKPFNSPFIEVLQNRFAYLAHDDDWYCKLYVRDLEDFLDIVIRKIEKYVECELHSKHRRKDKKHFQNKERISFLKKLANEIPRIDLLIRQRIFDRRSEGLFIDLNGMQIIENAVIVKTYIIGKFSDMDEMFNNIRQHKENSIQVNNLCFDGKEWSLL